MAAGKATNMGSIWRHLYGANIVVSPKCAPERTAALPPRLIEQVIQHDKQSRIVSASRDGPVPISRKLRAAGPERLAVRAVL